VPAQLTIDDIRREDARWKPGGAQFDQDAARLSALADQRGRRVTLEHLRTVGMGDPKNPAPLVVGVVPRLMESLSVLYRVPATRRLKQGSRVLSDSNAQVQAFNELSRRACLDNAWQLIDARRNLLRQAVISWVEVGARQSVQARIVEPHQVFRRPTPTVADTLEEDEAIAICVLDAPAKEDQRWQLWQHNDDGSWRMWSVTGESRMVGVQPYGDEGVVPFSELPLQMVYDDLPAGRAWLPIPESRLDFALNINALVNDLAYLVKQQAHSTPWVKTDDPAGVPTSIGPDKVWKVPGDSEVGVLNNSPMIADSVTTIEFALSALCLSESLPPDAFARNRAVRTGPALKVAERDLEARRQRQQPLAIDDERRAFRKIRAIHNYYASEWGLAVIDEDVTVSTSFARQWQPTDTRELQMVGGFDLAIGTASVIDYMQERYACTREEAIDLYDQVQADRSEYPVAQQQNPASLLDGPRNAALGRDGAQKTAGAFNPDLATSTEGASVVDAVRGVDAPETAPDLVQTTGVEKAQDTALNGAQVEAAVGIVEKVAAGTLPRAAGVSMLIEFFNLDPARADRLMGDVGRGFRAASQVAAPVFNPDRNLG
jgi:hypothetical protein